MLIHVPVIYMLEKPPAQQAQFFMSNGFSRFEKPKSRKAKPLP
jgi:hypothetical protein